MMVGRHFVRYRSMATGIAVSGAGLGSFLFPNLIRWLITEYRLQGCFIILSAVILNVAVFAMLIRPLNSYTRIPKLPEGKQTLYQNTTVDAVFENTCNSFEDKHNSCPEDCLVIPSYNANFNGENSSSEKYHLNSPQMHDAGTTCPKHNDSEAFMTSMTSMTSATSLNFVSSNTDVYVASLQQIDQPTHPAGSHGEDKETSHCACLKSGNRFLDTSLITNHVFLVYLTTLFLASFSPLSVNTILPSYAEYVRFSYF